MIDTVALTVNRTDERLRVTHAAAAAAITRIAVMRLTALGGTEVFCTLYNVGI